MKKYIELEKAINACFDGFADCRDDCADNIRNIPAADVVPVVRCGECKHWKRIRNDCILASCELDALVRSEDFFCAYGERKDGDDNG